MFNEEETIKAVKELASAMNSLRVQFSASFLRLEFSPEDISHQFEVILKTSLTLEDLSKNYLSMGWLTYYDLPEDWLSVVGCLEVTSHLETACRAVLRAHIKFITAYHEL